MADRLVRRIDEHSLITSGPRAFILFQNNFISLLFLLLFCFYFELLVV
ncbi:MAG: hypothetical protein Q8755_02660 [Candidatus Phytoplasma australasiaticum]|nr:hypothetical protein [Candidatus Phytoplasma australasiaticum]